MGKCCSCGSIRIGSINAKSRDLNFFEYGEYEHDGYVPEGLGIGGDDYIEFDYCLDCGQIQDFSKVTDEALMEAFDLDSPPSLPIPDDPEEMKKVFYELHKEAEKDIESMELADWKKYRSLGDQLEEMRLIEKGVVLK